MTLRHMLISFFFFKFFLKALVDAFHAWFNEVSIPMLLLFLLTLVVIDEIPLILFSEVIYWSVTH